MKIPTELKIGGFDWAIIQDETAHKDDDDYGYCSYKDLKIYIDPREPRQKQEEAFLHETFHAIIWNLGLIDKLEKIDKDLEEELNMALTRAFYQVLKDNNLLK